MSTSNTPGSDPVRTGSNPEAVVKSVTEAMQQGLAACMAVPQKIMQAQLETAGHAVDFMNRRMKAQAALWGGIGNISDAKGIAEAQRSYFEAVTKDYAEEMGQLANITRKNMAAVSELATSTNGSGFPTTKSS